MVTKTYLTVYEYEKNKEWAVIIDVRTSLEHQTSPNLPNSLNIYYKELLSNYKKYLPNKEQFIVIYCSFGNRSGKTVKFLRSKGYQQAFLLEGGVTKYLESKKKS